VVVVKFFVLGDLGILYCFGCCDWIARTTSGIRASRLRLGCSEDSKGSRSDPVEIVCRSQIRDIGVRGDRVSISEGRKEGSLNLWWNRSGEKLDLGFQATGKNPIFI